MLLHFLTWLTQSPLADLMSRADWIFAVVQTFHFFGFALLIGTIAIVDLRLLGFGMRRQAAAELAQALAPWTRWGLALMLITGPMMFSSDAVTYSRNPSFRFKMACLLAAVVYQFTVHRWATTPGISAGSRRLAAAVSLVLWTGVLAAGRMIAFV